MQSHLTAGIIVIGDEVLIGVRQDTNSGYIARKLTEAGLQVKKIIVVNDSVEMIKSALSEVEAKYDIAILTGGLGPTSDDVTRPALAEYFNTKLEFRDDLYSAIKKRFAERGIRLAKNMKNQAEFPAGAKIVPNELGSAAGMHFSRNEFQCFSLPGVPREMEGMLNNYILPALLETGRCFPLIMKTFRTAGIAESILAERIGDWDIESSTLAFLPSYIGVDVRVSVDHSGSSPDEVMMLAEERLRETVGDSIYGVNETELAAVIVKKLTRKGMRIAVAESCTGGLVAKMITSSPGASVCFHRGFITYSNEAKVDMLGVPETLIEKHGAVSAEVVAAMAEGAANWAHSNYALAITGIAGPDGGTPKKPVGTTYIALLHPDGIEVKKHHFHNDREINRIRSAGAALTMLFQNLK